jgi:hypothetical protein
VGKGWSHGICFMNIEHCNWCLRLRTARVISRYISESTCFIVNRLVGTFLHTASPSTPALMVSPGRRESRSGVVLTIGEQITRRGGGSSCSNHQLEKIVRKALSLRNCIIVLQWTGSFQQRWGHVDRIVSPTIAITIFRPLPTSIFTLSCVRVNLMAINA